MIMFSSRLTAGLFVEELIYLSCGLRINSRNLRKIRQACPLDGFHSAKMAEQRPLAGGPDPRNFLQAGLADIFFSARAMRTDGEAVRFVPQPLDIIKQGIAGRQLEWIAARHEESLATGIPVRPLRNCDQRHVRNAKGAKRLLRYLELTLPAIDQDEVRPRLIFVVALED